jgi:phosphoglycerate dehydrogenase-like enzyme
MILGWGGVGQAIGRRLLPFGPEITAVRRGVDEIVKDDSGVTVCGTSHWRQFLPQTDILIMTLPLTRETDQIVGDSELSSLPSHGFLVNVGRGEALHQKALLEKLNNGELGGAALDVLLTEPPDNDDPAWETPGLLITPHVARSKETPPFRWEPLFVENLRRYTAGEELLNVVDLSKGY